MPDWPAIRLDQYVLISSPRGETTPIPVTYAFVLGKLFMFIIILVSYR